jgi:CBS domain-containing protein
MNNSEFDDAYDDSHEDLDRIQTAVLETAVRELMVRDPLVVDADTTVVAAVNAMNEHHIGCVLVQKAGKLVGIFTERDVLRRVSFHDGNRSWKVETVMTRNPVTLPPSASVAYALNKMSVDGYRHIPIVNREGTAIGVLSVKDIIHFLVEFFPQDVINLPHHPDQAVPKSEHGA